MHKNLLIEEHEKIYLKKNYVGGRESDIEQEIQKKVFTEDENAPKKIAEFDEKVNKRKR